MATATTTTRRPRQARTPATPRASKPAISERDWQNTVLEFARLTCWMAWHDYDSRRNAPGLPDLLLLRPGAQGQPGRLLFIELKTERGRLRPEQRTWIEALRACGADVRVWRPSDWAEVMETLR